MTDSTSQRGWYYGCDYDRPDCVAGIREPFQPTEVLLMEGRTALTIRIPSELVESAREVKADGESLNSLVVQAVEREVRRRQGLQAYVRILQMRGAVTRRVGPHPDSSSLIRSLREGKARRD